MRSAVALVRCPSYDPSALDRALAEAVELAPLPEVKGASVLLKPNILAAAAPEAAVSTRGELLAAFARLVRSRGASRIMAGESPAFQSSELGARRSGIAAACEAAGVEWVDFAEGAELECPEGKRVRRFTVAAAVRGADILVSLPKLKTHGLMRYTGAIKNLFGIVPGLAKSAFHLRFPDPADLGSMFVDLALAAKSAYSLMDAVVAMEGPGPRNGRPVDTGLVIASRDPLALDWIASSVIGYDPLELPYLVDAASRGAWASGWEDIELKGLSLAEAKPRRFERIAPNAPGTSFTDSLPRPVYRLVRNLSVARPVFDHERCVRCGACVEICPPKALDLVADPDSTYGRKVRVDYEKCIRCYCCHEVCPEDAISLRKRLF